MDTTPRVEIEFSPGTWTNVSAYLRSAKVQRGKQRALDKVEAGTMVVELSNADRRFDPEHAAGPHFGNLMPGKAIRLRANFDTGDTLITYPVWTGFLDRITQTYSPPNDAVVVFECSDGMAKLAAATLGSPMEVTMAAETPNIWLRLGESSGPYAFDRSGNNRHGVIVGAPTFGQSSLLAEDNDAAMTFPDLVQSWVSTPPMAASLPWTVEFWFSGTLGVFVSGDITYMVLPADGVLTENGSLRIYGEHGVLDIDDTPMNQRLVVSQYGATHAIVMAAHGLFDGEPHHVVVVGESGQPIRLYVDGVEQTLNQSGTAMALRDVGFAIGNAYAGKGELTIDEFIAWNDARDSTERGRIDLAATGYAGESAADRIERVLDAVGWPEADRDISAEFDTTLRATPLNMTALAHLQQLEDTAEARLWIDPSGTLKLLGRHEHISGDYVVSQDTYGDGEGELHYTGMGSYSLDWDLVTNVVRRSSGDSIVTASDADSISAYGVRDQTDAAEVESQYQTQDFELDLAAWRVAHYAAPVAFIDGLQIEPRTDPANLWPAVLSRDLGDRLTFIRRPQNVGDPIETETILEGIAHTIAPKRWTTEFSIDAIGALRFFLFDDTEWGSEDWRFAA